jgi:hypothetical protein
MTIPVPIGLAGVVLRFIPNAAFAAMKDRVPKEFASLVSHKAILCYCKICKEIAEEYPGVEIIHVESQSAGVVSICL